MRADWVIASCWLHFNALGMRRALLWMKLHIMENFNVSQVHFWHMLVSMSMRLHISQAHIVLFTTDGEAGRMDYQYIGHHHQEDLYPTLMDQVMNKTCTKLSFFQCSEPVVIPLNSWPDESYNFSGNVPFS